MDKVIKIKDANNYVINLKQIYTNNENIQILEDAKDYIKCTLNLNMVFFAHDNYCHGEEKEIEINSEFIQIKLCDYLKQLLKDWNDRLSANNKELEVEVDLDDKK